MDWSLEKQKNRLRDIIRQAVNPGYRGARCRNLIGCEPAEFRTHLERQFQEGMCWDNYGRDGWHIDHIQPLCSFDVTDPEQASASCHFTNLQPLWARENCRKGGRQKAA